MTVQVRCSCGRSYQVPAHLLGKRATCKGCGTKLLLEPVAVNEASILDAEEVTDDEDASPSNVVQWGIAAALNSAASNPGNLRVNFLRFIAAFPGGFFKLHGALILLSAAVVWWSAWFLILAIPAALLVALYWWGTSRTFQQGCVNPAQVLSLDPPLVAVYTDLTSGEHKFPVIKILAQPLRRMSSGVPTVGQKISTIATYQGGHPHGQHWFDVLPVVTDIVTGNAREVQRVFASIPEAEWAWLELGLRQIPAARPIGNYPIFPAAAFHASPQLPSPAEIEAAVQEHFEGFGKNEFHRDLSDLSPEVARYIETSFGNLIRGAQRFGALVQQSKPQPEVFLILSSGVGHVRPAQPARLFDWPQIRSAFVTLPHRFDLILRPYEIVSLRRGMQFDVGSWIELENLINGLVRWRIEQA